MANNVSHKKLHVNENLHVFLLQPNFPYTYDDIPAGQTDHNLEFFTTEADLEFIVPVLQQILEINPDVLIVGKCPLVTGIINS